MVLRIDQINFVYKWYEYCPQCNQWRYDTALRGEATGGGKTTFIAAIVVLEFAGPDEIRVDSPNIPIAAASFEQADLLFSMVATMCGGRDQIAKESPLCGQFEVYDTEITYVNGRPGRIFRIAAVAGTNEGGLPTLFVRDEFHEWGEVGSRKARVATVVGKSTSKRRTAHGSGRIISLSTAGFDKENSLLGALCMEGEQAQYDPHSKPRFLMDWREAPESISMSALEDPEVRAQAVRAASAAADVLWSVKDRVNKWRQTDFPPHEWIRYYANRWVDVSQDSWLMDHPGAWQACKGEWVSNEANMFVITIDMALKRDSVAVSRMEKLSDGRIAIESKIWRPEGKRQIDHKEVFDYIREIAHGEGFRGVAYDPRFFEVPARMLEDEGILAIQFDQSPQRMAPACGEAFDRIVNQNIVHDGDPVLASHIKSAVKREQDRGFTLSKGRSKRHIDAAITLCMGAWLLASLDPNYDAMESVW